MDDKAIELLRRLAEVRTESEYLNIADDARALLEDIDRKGAVRPWHTAECRCLEDPSQGGNVVHCTACDTLYRGYVHLCKVHDEAPELAYWLRELFDYCPLSRVDDREAEYLAKIGGLLRRIEGRTE